MSFWSFLSLFGPPFGTFWSFLCICDILGMNAGIYLLLFDLCILCLIYLITVNLACNWRHIFAIFVGFYHFVSFLSKPVKKVSNLGREPTFGTPFGTPFWTPILAKCPLFTLDHPLPPSQTQPHFKEIRTLTTHEVYIVCRLPLESCRPRLVTLLQNRVTKNNSF